MFISDNKQIIVKNLFQTFEHKTGLRLDMTDKFIEEFNDYFAERVDDGSYNREQEEEEEKKEQPKSSRKENTFNDDVMPDEEEPEKEEPKKEEPKKEEPEKMTADKLAPANQALLKAYKEFYFEIFKQYDDAYNKLNPEQKEASKNYVTEFEGMMKEFFIVVMAPEIRNPEKAPQGRDKNFILDNLKYGVINEGDTVFVPYETEADKLYTSDKELTEQMKTNGTYTGDGICNQINQSLADFAADTRQNGNGNIFGLDNRLTPFETLCQSYKVAQDHYKSLGFFSWLFAFSERKALKNAATAIEAVKNQAKNGEFKNTTLDDFVKAQIKRDSTHDFGVYGVFGKEVPDYSEFSGRKQAMEKKMAEAKEKEKEGEKRKDTIEAQKSTKLARRLTYLLTQKDAQKQYGDLSQEEKNKYKTYEEFEAHHIKKNQGKFWLQVGKDYGNLVFESKSAAKNIFEFKNKTKVLDMMRKHDEFFKKDSKDRFPIHSDSGVSIEEVGKFINDFMKPIDPEEERKKAFEQSQKEANEAEETLKQQIYDKQVEKYKIKQAEKEKQQEEEDKKNGIEPKKKEENREPVEIDPNDLDDLEDNFNFATFNFESYVNNLTKEPAKEVKAPANENKEAPANENKEAPANDKNEAPVNEGNDESIPQA